MSATWVGRPSGSAAICGGVQLNEEQMKDMKAEAEPGASSADLLEHLPIRFENLERDVRAMDPAKLEEPREVGRGRLPATAIGLIVHIAEHTQRHLGQAITTAKLVRAMRDESGSGPAHLGLSMTDLTLIIRRFINEYQTGGDEAVAEELLDSEFYDHTPFPGFGPTREDVKALFRVLRGAFPDLRAEIIEQYADGDRVVTRKTFHGTHEGPFAGKPPSGRPVAIRVVDIVRIANGRIREHWNVVDVAGLMAQYGVTHGVGESPLFPDAGSVS